MCRSATGTPATFREFTSAFGLFGRASMSTSGLRFRRSSGRSQSMGGLSRGNVPGPRESQEPPETVASMDAEPENGDAGRRTPPHSRADLVGVSAGFRCETYRPLSAWLSESNVGRDEGRQARSRHPDTRRRSIRRTEPPREARQLSRVRSQSWRPQRPNRDRAADSVVRHSRRGVG